MITNKNFLNKCRLLISQINNKFNEIINVNKMKKIIKCKMKYNIKFLKFKITYQILD